MKIYREKAGVISAEPLWIIYHKGYLYEGLSLFQVIFIFYTEYKNDKHLIG